MFYLFWASLHLKIMIDSLLTILSKINTKCTKLPKSNDFMRHYGDTEIKDSLNFEVIISSFIF